MKNLDIEKLERQNIYTAPDHFFDDIQAKVLQETVHQKSAKVFKMNWAYAAAAAVAMIFGITFFLNQGGEENTAVTENQALAVNAPAVNTSPQTQVQNEATVAYKILENDLTSAASVNQKGNKEQFAVSTKAATSAEVQNKTNTLNPEVQVDQILANFTSAELADLGKNTEQDIYLDLYY